MGTVTVGSRSMEWGGQSKTFVAADVSSCVPTLALQQLDNP